MSSNSNGCGTVSSGTEVLSDDVADVKDMLEEAARNCEQHRPVKSEPCSFDNNKEVIVLRNSTLSHPANITILRNSTLSHTANTTKAKKEMEDPQQRMASSGFHKPAFFIWNFDSLPVDTMLFRSAVDRIRQAVEERVGQFDEKGFYVCADVQQLPSVGAAFLCAVHNVDLIHFSKANVDVEDKMRAKLQQFDIDFRDVTESYRDSGRGTIALLTNQAKRFEHTLANLQRSGWTTIVVAEEQINTQGGLAAWADHVITLSSIAADAIVEPPEPIKPARTGSTKGSTYNGGTGGGDDSGMDGGEAMQAGKRKRVEKTAFQCFHGQNCKMKEKGCKFWHPTGGCRWFPNCAEGAWHCPMGHPFCGVYCQCPPDQRDWQLNHRISKEHMAAGGGIGIPTQPQAPSAATAAAASAYGTWSTQMAAAYPTYG